MIFSPDSPGDRRGEAGEERRPHSEPCGSRGNSRPFPQTDPLAKAEFATIRERLIKIAARVIEHVTRIRIQMVQFVRKASKKVMPAPNSEAVDSAAINRLIEAQQNDEVLILIDMPASRTGSRAALEYLPEASSREMLRKWVQPVAFEDSVTWKSLHESFLESVGKIRVFAHPAYRSTFEAGIGWDDQEAILRWASLKCIDREPTIYARAAMRGNAMMGQRRH